MIKNSVDIEKTPESRAKRLKIIRSMSGFSQKSLCEEAGINIHTYKSWELGRYGGLPEKNAKKIIACLSKHGVSCQLSWLMSSEGNSPTIQLSNQSNHDNGLERDSHCLSEVKEYIHKTPGSVHTVVKDLGMFPALDKGDHVCAIKIDLDDIESINNTICLVQTSSDEGILRQAYYDKKGNALQLRSTNTALLLEQKIIELSNVIFVARLTRIYKI